VIRFDKIASPNSPDIVKVRKNDPVYPKRLLTILGKKAPATLYLQGNVSLLRSNGVGFSGSRKPSVTGIEVTRDCAEQVANAGAAVVSGNAAGIDYEAHFRALFSGGSTILVLPEGISHFHIKQHLRPVWDWERVLVVSQFNPYSTWKGFRAMARNLVIIGLSKAMVVIEANEDGGTMNAGLEALKCGTPLHVIEYQDTPTNAKGNKILLDMGGKPLTRSREIGRVNMSRVFDDVKLDPAISSKEGQLGLLW